ncbi:MAG: hypothetical protein R3D03_08240 [Geminicoccaceae bacterium]
MDETIYLQLLDLAAAEEGIAVDEGKPRQVTGDPLQCLRLDDVEDGSGSR